MSTPIIALSGGVFDNMISSCFFLNSSLVSSIVFLIYSFGTSCTNFCVELLRRSYIFVATTNKT